ncbi:CRC domain-containing protein [Pycnococcus provasolii]
MAGPSPPPPAPAGGGHDAPGGGNGGNAHNNPIHDPIKSKRKLDFSNSRGNGDDDDHMDPDSKINPSYDDDDERDEDRAPVPVPVPGNSKKDNSSGGSEAPPPPPPPPPMPPASNAAEAVEDKAAEAAAMLMEIAPTSAAHAERAKSNSAAAAAAAAAQAQEQIRAAAHVLASPARPFSSRTNATPTQTPVKSKKCNCRNSKCLKLYCECFASGEHCKNCSCQNCFNNPEHEKVRQEAIEATLERNPHAFRPKINTTPGRGVPHSALSLPHTASPAAVATHEQFVTALASANPAMAAAMMAAASAATGQPPGAGGDTGAQAGASSIPGLAAATAWAAQAQAGCTPAMASAAMQAIANVIAAPGNLMAAYGVTGKHAKGCHCKRSFCLKKYCECFQGGILCSDICKCTECKNYQGSKELAKILTKNERREAAASPNAKRLKVSTGVASPAGKKGGFAGAADEERGAADDSAAAAYAAPLAPPPRIGSPKEQHEAAPVDGAKNMDVSPPPAALKVETETNVMVGAPPAPEQSDLGTAAAALAAAAAALNMTNGTTSHGGVAVPSQPHPPLAGLINRQILDALAELLVTVVMESAQQWKEQNPSMWRGLNGAREPAGGMSQNDDNDERRLMCDEEAADALGSAPTNESDAVHDDVVEEENDDNVEEDDEMQSPRSALVSHVEVSLLDELSLTLSKLGARAGQFQTLTVHDPAAATPASAQKHPAGGSHDDD